MRKKLSTFFFMDEFQWFLIALSVRPFSNFAISAHLLPVHGSADAWMVCKEGAGGGGR